MGFSKEAGYVPSTVPTILGRIMANFNVQFNTSYTTDTFVGSNHYKFAYAIAQDIAAGEVTTAEAFLKLQDYIKTTNESISRPVVTRPGLIEKLMSKGYVASAKPPADADAGKAFICVDVVDNHANGKVTITNITNLLATTPDTIHVGATIFTAQAGAATPGTATFQAATSTSATATSLAAQINAHATAGAFVEAVAYGAVVSIRAIAQGTSGNSIVLTYQDNHATSVGATVTGSGTLTGGAAGAVDYDTVKLDICTTLKDSVVMGVVTQGDQVETIVLSNGQSFDWKYSLPNRIPTAIRITTVLSENNQLVIKTPEDQKAAFMANLAAKYALGKDLEPQRYFNIVDAPWAASVLVEYSTDVVAGVLSMSPTWASAVIETNFDDLYEVSLDLVQLVED